MKEYIKQKFLDLAFYNKDNMYRWEQKVKISWMLANTGENPFPFSNDTMHRVKPRP